MILKLLAAWDQLGALKKYQLPQNSDLGVESEERFKFPFLILNCSQNRDLLALEDRVPFKQVEDELATWALPSQ